MMWKNPYMGVPIFFEFQKNTLRHPRVPLVCKHYGFPLWEKHGFHSGNTLSFHFGSIVGFHFGSSMAFHSGNTMSFHFGSIVGFHFGALWASILGALWVSILWTHALPFWGRASILGAIRATTTWSCGFQNYIATSIRFWRESTASYMCPVNLQVRVPWDVMGSLYRMGCLHKN